MRVEGAQSARVVRGGIATWFGSLVCCTRSGGKGWVCLFMGNAFGLDGAVGRIDGEGF